jgi:hypothetical protein
MMPINTNTPGAPAVGPNPQAGRLIESGHPVKLIYGERMEYDQTKVDEMTLALMYLTTFSLGDGAPRSWKGYDWEVLSRLHAAGFIADPVGKAKSVALTGPGAKLSGELFQKYFSKTSVPPHR